MSDSTYLLGGFTIKNALMTQLQQQVAELGVCPDCHAKTMHVRHEALGMEFSQCAMCLKVYVLPCGVA